MRDLSTVAVEEVYEPLHWIWHGSSGSLRFSAQGQTWRYWVHEHETRVSLRVLDHDQELAAEPMRCRSLQEALDMAHELERNA